MKKIYSIFTALLLCVLGTLSADAARVTLRIADPDAVTVTVLDYATFTQSTPTLRAGDNVIQYDAASGAQVNISAKQNYSITSAEDTDPAVGDIPVQFNTVYLTCNENTDGHTFIINTVNLEEARTSAVTMTVTDFRPGLIRIYRGDESLEITESPQTIRFNPETESVFQVQRLDFQPICSVKLNDVAQEAVMGQYRFNVADGDRIEVTADYPKVDVPVTVTYPAGLNDLISSFTVDYAPVTDWNTPGFTVTSGSNISLQFNTAYKLDRVLINNVEQQIGMGYINYRVGTEPVDIIVEAHEYGFCHVTVDVTDPSHLLIYPSSNPSAEPATFDGNTCTLEVDERDPYIVIRALDAYNITSITDGNGNALQPDYSNRIQVYDNMMIYVTTEERKFDGSLVVYIDNLEPVTYAYWQTRENRDMNDFVQGYNVLRFESARQLDYLIRVAATEQCYAYENGVPAADQYSPNYFNWQKIPDNGTVLKVFFGQEPALYTVKVDMPVELRDKAHVVTDMVTPVFDYAEMSLMKGTRVDMTFDPAASVVVKLDDVAITPAEDGSYSFAVSADHNVTVTEDQDPTGIDSVTSGDTTGDVYNVVGIRVLSGASEADIKTLPAGLYIFNGRKFVVK